MYTSPFEWTISKYSIPFEIIPRLIPSHFKGHLRHVFTSTHMNTFTFQKLPQMPVGLFSWTEYPVSLYAVIILCPKSLQPIQAHEELCINNYQLKWPLEGRSAPRQVALSGRSPLRRPVPGSQVTRITGVGWVWMEALPPGPFLVSVISYKNIHHCKSVNERQTGN